MADVIPHYLLYRYILDRLMHDTQNYQLATAEKVSTYDTLLPPFKGECALYIK